VAIVGPTASGKGELSLDLAKNLGGEIVSADSQKIYRHLDIGTAKPPSNVRRIVPHHLIDVVDPDEEFSVGLYKDLALREIGLITERKKIPFVVGGSGLYVWALLEGWEIPSCPPNREFRSRMEERVKREGVEKIYQELKATDDRASQHIDPRNPRRIIRALELKHAGFGLERRKDPPFDALIIGLYLPRDELHRHQDERVDQMIAQGLVEEVEGLLKMGYSPDLPSLSSIGYRQISSYLQERLSLSEAVDKIKFATHRLCCRQFNWFKPGDERIHWFRPHEGYAIRHLIADFTRSPS
jgi:tRNA dimethylallyltransferase